MSEYFQRKADMSLQQSAVDNILTPQEGADTLQAKLVTIYSRVAPPADTTQRELKRVLSGYTEIPTQPTIGSNPKSSGKP
ncbi:MAG TPA: hypothetical protein VMR41_02530, partial [Patescibacteria group bacterium]|nr:hypothetical protein [Patescibacteria group bacterium]